MASTYSSKALIGSLSERLRNYRIDMGLTQKQLAEKSGVSLRCIQHLENKEDVQVSNLCKVMIALGLSDRITELVPDVSRRPSDYLVKESPRKRVRAKKSDADAAPFTWGDDTSSIIK